MTLKYRIAEFIRKDGQKYYRVQKREFLAWYEISYLIDGVWAGTMDTREKTLKAIDQDVAVEVFKRKSKVAKVNYEYIIKTIE